MPGGAARRLCGQERRLAQPGQQAPEAPSAASLLLTRQAAAL